MEYEIEAEELLFDESTNPSLLHRAPPPRPARDDKRKRQSAEHIPEEEPDNQMG